MTTEVTHPWPTRCTLSFHSTHKPNAIHATGWRLILSLTGPTEEQLPMVLVILGITDTCIFPPFCPVTIVRQKKNVAPTTDLSSSLSEFQLYYHWLVISQRRFLSQNAVSREGAVLVCYTF